MKTRTIEVREGEDVGPVDWSHSIAKDMPLNWRDAEKSPADYLFNGRELLKVCMYDGWPYWTPRPAVLFVGPLHHSEWTYFDSYGVHPNSIRARAAIATTGAQS